MTFHSLFRPIFENFHHSMPKATVVVSEKVGCFRAPFSLRLSLALHINPVNFSAAVVQSPTRSVRPHPCWTFPYCLEWVKQLAIPMSEGRRQKTCEQSLTDLGLIWVERRRVREDLIEVFMMVKSLSGDHPGTFLHEAPDFRTTRSEVKPMRHPFWQTARVQFTIEI